MIKPIFLLSFLSLFISPVFAQGDCFDNLELSVKTQFEDLESNYMRISGPDAAVKPAKRPVLLRGQNGKAVLVQHGFMASPFEVEIIGKTLNDAGYTVYMPLIAGFGSTTDVANTYNRNHWKQFFAINVGLLKRCYSDISLVGFSTGGTLIYNYLANHQDDSTIKSAVLLSPFFAMHSDFSKMLKAMSKMMGFVGLHNINMSRFSADLLAVEKNPQGYNWSVPLKAATEVTALGAELMAKPLKKKITVPVLSIYSEYDTTISQSALINIAIENIPYSDIETLPYDQKIPHQMAVPNVSFRAQDIANRTLKFINFKY